MQVDGWLQQRERRAHDEEINLQDAYMLLDHVSKLQSQFEALLTQLELLYEGPLFWNSNTSSGLPHYDAECHPKHTSIHNQLQFLSAPAAGSIIACSAFRLRLWMLAIELRRSMNGASAHGDQASRDWNKTIAREQDLSSKTAWLILEAIPYLSSCFEGSVVLQAPLKIVEEYYRDIDTTSRT